MNTEALVPIGRILFGFAMLGLGVEHFIYDAFVTGRAPGWPEGLGGGQFFAYATGALVVAAALATLSGIRVRAITVFVAALVFGWAVLRHIPVIATDTFLAPSYTRAVKALAIMGGLLAVAAVSPPIRWPRNGAIARFANQRNAFIVVATVCLAVFMVNNGAQHFIYSEFVAALIPSWFPGNPYFWCYYSAVALFAGALGMLYRRTAWLAALLTGVMVFAWVWIVHVPRIGVSISDNVAVFEATAIAGIAFMIAGSRSSATSTAPQVEATQVEIS